MSGTDRTQPYKSSTLSCRHLFSNDRFFEEFGMRQSNDDSYQPNGHAKGTWFRAYGPGPFGESANGEGPGPSAGSPEEGSGPWDGLWIDIGGEG
jgi:hypothetical protein